MHVYVCIHIYVFHLSISIYVYFLFHYVFKYTFVTPAKNKKVIHFYLVCIYSMYDMPYVSSVLRCPCLVLDMFLFYLSIIVQSHVLTVGLHLDVGEWPLNYDRP